MYETTIVEAKTLGQAWEKACKVILTKGHQRFVQAPEYQIATLDLPMIIKVSDPLAEPRLSKLASDSLETVKEYTETLINGYPDPEKEKEFEYTYHSRLRCYPDCKVRAWLPAVSTDQQELRSQVKKIIADEKCVVTRIDQVDAAIKILKKDPTRRTVVMHTWIPYRDLMKFGPRREETSSPCLVLAYPQLVDGKLHLFVVMKTNDLYNAWPGNAYAFTALQKYLADGIGVKTGTYTHFSVSMHLYKDKWAEARKKFKVR
jgi:thymidylate synthase (methanogen type)